MATVHVDPDCIVLHSLTSILVMLEQASFVGHRGRRLLTFYS